MWSYSSRIIVIRWIEVYLLFHEHFMLYLELGHIVYIITVLIRGFLKDMTSLEGRILVVHTLTFYMQRWGTSGPGAILTGPPCGIFTVWNVSTVIIHCIFLILSSPTPCSYGPQRTWAKWILAFKWKRFVTPVLEVTHSHGNLWPSHGNVMEKSWNFFG